MNSANSLISNYCFSCGEGCLHDSRYNFDLSHRGKPGGSAEHPTLTFPQIAPGLGSSVLGWGFFDVAYNWKKPDVMRSSYSDM